MYTKSTSIHGMQRCGEASCKNLERKLKASERKKKKNDDAVVMAWRFMLNWATINISLAWCKFFSTICRLVIFLCLPSRITVAHRFVAVTERVVGVRFFLLLLFLIEFDFIMVYLLLLLLLVYFHHSRLFHHQWTYLLCIVCVSNHNHNLLALFEFATACPC